MMDLSGSDAKTSLQKNFTRSLRGSYYYALLHEIGFVNVM
jgi:hypothetical protein